MPRISPASRRIFSGGKGGDRGDASGALPGKGHSCTRQTRPSHPGTARARRAARGRRCTAKPPRAVGSARAPPASAPVAQGAAVVPPQAHPAPGTARCSPQPALLLLAHGPGARGCRQHGGGGEQAKGEELPRPPPAGPPVASAAPLAARSSAHGRGRLPAAARPGPGPFRRCPPLAARQPRLPAPTSAQAEGTGRARPLRFPAA